jgi:hypothetical protein
MPDVAWAKGYNFSSKRYTIFKNAINKDQRALAYL